MDPLTKPEWRAGVNQVLGSSWTPYTPVLTASTTSPSGWTCIGAYYRVGALVVARIRIEAGSSMTAGSGNYRVSLPVTANTGQERLPYPANLYDSSTGARCIPIALIVDPTYIEFRYPTTWPATGNQAVTASAPWTWAASDQINAVITYEAAAST